MTLAQNASRSERMPAPLLRALVLNFIWVNVSEVIRYFVFVMPMMREALPGVENVAPMNIPVFLVWGVWDTVLVVSASLIPWLFLHHLPKSVATAVLAGTFSWATIFVLLWLGLLNMNLASPQILAVALPLAWIEMVIAALIVRWVLVKDEKTEPPPHEGHRKT